MVIVGFISGVAMIAEEIILLGLWIEVLVIAVDAVSLMEGGLVKNLGLLSRSLVKIMKEQVRIAQIAGVSEKVGLRFKAVCPGRHAFDVFAVCIDGCDAGNSFHGKKFQVVEGLGKGKVNVIENHLLKSQVWDEDSGFSGWGKKILMMKDHRTEAPYVVVVEVGDKNVIDLIGEVRFPKAAIYRVATIDENLCALEVDPRGRIPKLVVKRAAST